jgi:hypothetical protein
MSLSNYAEESFLNALRGVSFTPPATLYVKLHLGAPGEDCASNAAAETTRKVITFAAYSAGQIVSNSTPSWTSYPAVEVVTYYSVWDHLTAGNPWFWGQLTAQKSMGIGDTLQLPTLIVTID